MKRIGLLGGTFDPIHNGHIAFAQAAQRQCLLDEVVFIPAHIPVFKRNKGVSSPQIRLDMTTLAIKDIAGFKVSAIELNRGGDTYTIDTLRQLHKIHPKDKLFFLLSSDAAITVRKWKEGTQLANYAHLVISSRPQFDWPVNFDFSSLDGIYKHIFVNEPMLDISSTDIRKRVKQGKTISQFVPCAVANYITNHNLYLK